MLPGTIAQSVTCLTADQGVASWILDWSHTFVEIDHEIISMAILLPSPDLRRVVVSNKPKYVHKVLVNRLVKLAQEKVWSAVDRGKEPNQTKKFIVLSFGKLLSFPCCVSFIIRF